jgi:Tfp pilus tip-associated adhesin PilY1
LANSREELVNALSEITTRIKSDVKFYGAAPAPTILNHEDTLIAAYFDPSNWTGDVVAYNQSVGGNWDSLKWTASDELPNMRKIFSINTTDHTSVIDFTNNFVVATGCKSIGDIINSTPLVVGAPPFFYGFDGYGAWKRSITRDPMIYVGANDGALHAFGLADGIEKWAFVPENLLTKFNKAGTDPQFDQCDDEYCHQYFVDGSPQAADIFDGSAWKTILVVGEREGGAAYFALDITSGKPLDDGTDPSSYLWQFTDAELGQTWAEPAIERIKDTTSTCTDGGGATIDCASWGVFFGSGYYPALQDTKAAFLYGIQAHDKAALWKDADDNTVNRIRLSTTYALDYDGLTSGFTVGDVITGSPSGASGTIISHTANDATTGTLVLENVTGVFQNDDNLRVNGGDHAKANGTANGLPLNDALAPTLLADLDDDYMADRIYVGNLHGTMYRVADIGKGQTPSISRLFDFDPALLTPNVNPIRSKAAYGYASAYGSDIWVYYGTGRYETQADKSNMVQQYFFGLKDDLGSPASYALGDLVNLEANYATDAGSGLTVRSITGSNNSNASWVLKLDNTSAGLLGSERVIEKPLVVGGIVFFTTFIPSSDTCAGGGKTWLFALDYQTGLAPTTPVFDLNGDGKFDDNDRVVDANDVEHNVAGIKIGSGKGSHPALLRDTLFVSTTGSSDSGGGGPVGLLVNLPSLKVRLNAWRQN